MNSVRRRYTNNLESLQKNVFSYFFLYTFLMIVLVQSHEMVLWFSSHTPSFKFYLTTQQSRSKYCLFLRVLVKIRFYLNQNWILNLSILRKRIFISYPEYNISLKRSKWKSIWNIQNKYDYKRVEGAIRKKYYF